MIDSTLMLTILPCERLQPLDIIFYFPFFLNIYSYSLQIKQHFKTSCLTAKRGKVQLSYIFVYVYIYFFKLLVLERQTILYWRIWKLQPKFSPQCYIFIQAFYTDHVFYFKMCFRIHIKIFPMLHPSYWNSIFRDIYELGKLIIREPCVGSSFSFQTPLLLTGPSDTIILLILPTFFRIKLAVHRAIACVDMISRLNFRVSPNLDSSFFSFDFPTANLTDLETKSIFSRFLVIRKLLTDFCPPSCQTSAAG